MLVLSRRPGEKVVFPALGISVEVLRSRGSVTRLGIEAPSAIQIAREEVLDSEQDRRGSEFDRPAPDERRDRHALRNQLNSALLELQLLQRQLQMGQAARANERLSAVFAELNNLQSLEPDSHAGERPLRVLVVEDQANERELLASCLRLAGVDVQTADGGEQALDWLHDNDLPDLVLLDMRMPGIDGPGLINAIRGSIRLSRLRLFAVSGSEPGEFGGQRPAVDGWFAKPVRIDALLAAVRAESKLATVSV